MIRMTIPPHPDARLVAPCRLQEGECVVPGSQGGLVVSDECQPCSRHAKECSSTDPEQLGGS